MGAPVGDWVETSTQVDLLFPRVEQADGSARTGLTITDFAVNLYDQADTNDYTKAAGAGAPGGPAIVVTVNEVAKGLYEWSFTSDAGGNYKLLVEYPTDGYVAQAGVTATSIKTGYSLANDAITAAVIATGAVDADAIASNAITAAKINADAITEAKIADDAIATEHIATGAISADSLAADTITEAKIANDAIATEHIATAAITADSLGADLITAAKIADDAIAAEHLATDAITNDAIAASAVTELAVWIVHIGVASTGTIWYFRSHLEKNGEVVVAGCTNGTIKLYDTDGAQVGSTQTDAAPDAQHEFHNSITNTPTADRTYYVEGEVTFGGVTYTSRVAFGTAD